MAPNKYDPICHVFSRDLAKAKNVKILIDHINSLNDNSSPIKLEAEDKCVLFISKNETFVSGFFDEFESFTIPTVELMRLVEEWLRFLGNYEAGNIPGVIPDNMKAELVIVPRSAVKEEYWNGDDEDLV
ncbi:hypothetical protein GCM10025777_02030 [Membranihabitans marinus]